MPDTPSPRDAIIHAVWGVIHEKGMSALSMRTVAAAAGVSVGRIQYWFPSKDALLQASLEKMLATAQRLHGTSTAGAEDAEALWHLLWRPVLQAQESKGGVSVFYQYVAAGINHPSLARMLAEAKHGTENEAVRLLTEIAPDLHDPHTAARALVATADGLTMRVLLGDLSAAQAEQTLRAELNRVTT